MTVSTETIIQSRQGFLTIFMSVICFSFAGISIQLLLEAYTFRTRLMPLSLLTACTVGLLFFWFGIELLTTQIVVSLQGITVKSITSSKFLCWRQVQKLYIVPTYFGLYNVSLKQDEKRHLFVPTYTFANRRELIQVSIEAAKTKNPELTLNAWVENLYGLPPYGIFTDKDRRQPHEAAGFEK